MYGEGYDRRDFEIHHCEFVNGHDLYLVATNMHFHHNWIDNLQDEGMMLDAQPSASGRIHSNVITRCLSPISMAIKEFTAGPWFIYRNLIDLRAPTAGHRPRFVGDTAVFRFGNAFKSNETAAPDGPHDVFHNTFLVADQQDDAAYLHYLSDLSPHLRRSFNNIFVAVNPSTASDRAITFVPPPSFPGPTDGNLYHRFGTATAAGISVSWIHIQVRRLSRRVVREPRRTAQQHVIPAEQGAIRARLRGEQPAHRSRVSADQRRRRV